MLESRGIVAILLVACLAGCNGGGPKPQQNQTAAVFDCVSMEEVSEKILDIKDAGGKITLNKCPLFKGESLGGIGVKAKAGLLEKRLVLDCGENAKTCTSGVYPNDKALAESLGFDPEAYPKISPSKDVELNVEVECLQDYCILRILNRYEESGTTQTETETKTETKTQTSTKTDTGTTTGTQTLTETATSTQTFVQTGTQTETAAPTRKISMYEAVMKATSFTECVEKQQQGYSVNYELGQEFVVGEKKYWIVGCGFDSQRVLKIVSDTGDVFEIGDESTMVPQALREKTSGVSLGVSGVNCSKYSVSVTITNTGGENYVPADLPFTDSGVLFVSFQKSLVSPKYAYKAELPQIPTGASVVVSPYVSGLGSGVSQYNYTLYLNTLDESTKTMGTGSCEVPVEEEEPEEPEENETVPTCPASCDDGNSCTIDSCSPASGYLCVHSPKVPCCGNSVCETGENYVTCSDCPPPDVEEPEEPVEPEEPEENVTFEEPVLPLTETTALLELVESPQCSALQNATFLVEGRVSCSGLAYWVGACDYASGTVCVKLEEETHEASSVGTCSGSPCKKYSCIRKTMPSCSRTEPNVFRDPGYCTSTTGCRFVGLKSGDVYENNALEALLIPGTLSACVNQESYTSSVTSVENYECACNVSKNLCEIKQVVFEEETPTVEIIDKVVTRAAYNDSGLDTYELSAIQYSGQYYVFAKKRYKLLDRAHNVSFFAAQNGTDIFIREQESCVQDPWGYCEMSGMFDYVFFEGRIGPLSPDYYHVFFETLRPDGTVLTTYDLWVPVGVEVSD